jgi:hypothetical protein
MRSFDVDTAEQICEDELPPDIPDDLYDWWYARSYVDFVRMGPSIIPYIEKAKHCIDFALRNNTKITDLYGDTHLNEDDLKKLAEEYPVSIRDLFSVFHKK